MKPLPFLFKRLLAIALFALPAWPSHATVSEAVRAVTPRNSPEAMAELCRLARRGDADAQYELAWLYAHGRGSERHDDWAAYLFTAASLQGHAFAEKMLKAVNWPVANAPACFTVASVLPPASARHAAPPPHIEALVRKLAPQYQVSPQLVLSIIAVESNFNVTAVSPKAAMGLMQLIPQTAKRFGVRNPFDAQDNIRGGVAYLRWLLAYFEGDVVLVAAAYNAGEGAVNQFRGVPPYDETREYVRRVVGRFGSTRQPFDAKITEPSPQMHSLRRLAGIR
ncbi:MAG: transglycosylase SLT domain-containing protein [Burkholderiaceae bacterium]|nr:transglycosylase SLT domain-containing protein [Burkholderiaceae bacterium]